MMPCAPLMKPKLGFSIDALVGSGKDSRGSASPPLADTCSDRGASPPTSMPPSPLSSPGLPIFSDIRTPLAMRALLEFDNNKPTLVQRPQPINGATQLPSQEINLPPSLLAKLPGHNGGLPPGLLSPHLHLLPQLQGLHGAGFPPGLNPLMMGGAGGAAVAAAAGLAAAHLPREYPLYPWLLSRHGRVFPHGLPSPEQLAYLLQPFRRPKRIRTAFSPTQLLKLEQSFEKNQYVVGAERKTLAQNLNLSETQVKVWFQNRRTKEKRVTQDGEGGEGEGGDGVGEDSESGDRGSTRETSSSTAATADKARHSPVAMVSVEGHDHDDLLGEDSEGELEDDGVSGERARMSLG
ncbi:unnamed protein product [Meganyctiphanes norvegica]|uniref:Homeobox domain-containing protein n=1 Tax=Meganyctiphanes norvegica TaxID=48144 RepID=A0AAV2QLK1_MEGNR